MTLSRRSLLQRVGRTAILAAAGEVVPGPGRRALGSQSAPVHMFVVWGQSAARGANVNPNDRPFTTAPLYPSCALMFDPGVIPDGRPVSEFVPLHEQNRGVTHETICSQAAFTIERNYIAQTGNRLDSLMTVSAQGGQPYATIGVGTPVYAEILRLVAAARAIAAAKGRSLIVDAMLALHGETDFAIGTTEAQYIDDLIALRQAVTSDIRALTGQTGPVRMLTYQTYHGDRMPGINPRIPLAQLALMDLDPLITCIGPMYFLPMALKDIKHPSAIGYAQLGELFGTAAFEALFGPGFMPCRTTGVSWASTGPVPRLHVRYNRPVTIDTSNQVVSTVGITPGMGYDFADGTAKPPAITHVASVRGAPDTVEITLSRMPSGKTPQLFYACRSTGLACGNRTGARGVVRGIRPFLHSRTGIPLYHWACVEILTLPPASP